MELRNRSRRNFIRQGSLLTTLLFAKPLLGRSRAWKPAGYPVHNIPVNKALDPAWVKSLYHRGEPGTYLKTRNELSFIGMPVGGLHAGTVYMGGDGRLWLWQIYNESEEGKNEGIDPKTVLWEDGTSTRKIRSRDGASYVEPAIAENKRRLDQGFALRITYRGRAIVKELNEKDWDEVSFEAKYPVATVKYTSRSLPVQVTLKGYSPFVPLDAERSSLPATILRVAVENKSDELMQVSVLGWMENAAGKVSAKEGSGTKTNVARRQQNRTELYYELLPKDESLKQATDFGTTALAVMNAQAKPLAGYSSWPVVSASFDLPAVENNQADVSEKSTGALVVSSSLKPRAVLQEDFIIAWHFNNPNPKLRELVKDAQGGYYYGKRFGNAGEVAGYVAENFTSLTRDTELWHQTWNDTSLPHWFMERTFVNIGTLATANTYRFASGRFWGWEGVGACAGTCTHVYQYAHAIARIFPELERRLRTEVDLGAGFVKDTGAIIFRAENESRPAIDGQAGTILRFYREHQMSSDTTFLSQNWQGIRKAVAFMLAQDKNGDGMTDTPMENTLDAVWEGEIAWIVGLCIAAARAAQAMAEEVGDGEMARICREYVSKGRANMEQHLYNGEYFIHRPDAVQGRKKLGSYNTCHIDQVYGQSWAHQVGLPRVLDQAKTLSALKALWKYNFTPNVGPYIKTHLGGRPYAVSGEGGMVMNTNPLNEEKPFGENVTWQLGYFHECMSGFEHQVAAHMMAEGMVEEALVLTRFIHDRYHGARRNPYNEIECSDHYARAMASYGTFITACGFEYHGPKGNIQFAPKWSKENFKAPFTVAEGWGTYSQKITGNRQEHRLALKYGSLRLQQCRFEIAGKRNTPSVSVMLGQQKIPATFEQQDGMISVRFNRELIFKQGQQLSIVLG